MSDPINPDHYKTPDGIECIDAIRAMLNAMPLTPFEAFCTGTAVAYLWRWKNKNGPEDIRKAAWFLDKLTGASDGRAEGG